MPSCCPADRRSASMPQAAFKSFLREAERGFSVGPVRIPIVPQAILFDLINGGDKVWGRRSPYHEMGFQAAASAGKDFALGSAGAGFGTIVAAGEGRLIRGGLGSASEAVPGLATTKARMSSSGRWRR